MWFYNDHLEILMVRLMKEDASIIAPRTLGRIRRALAFVNGAIKKYLSVSDLHTIALDSDNAGKDNAKKCDSSEYSENEDDESDNSSIECAPKSKVNNSIDHSINTKKEIKEKNSVKDGCALSLKEKPFFCNFGAPAAKDAIVGNVLSKMIAEKKKESQEFFALNNACMTKKRNQYSEALPGDSE